MANGEPTQTASWRDGTSQSRRILRELDPDYARIDERTTRDLLAFAWQYSLQLKYFGPSDPDNAQRDWRGFIADAVDLAAAAPKLDAAARYAAAPEKFPAQQAGRYAQPHFALFLAFLELLGDVRGQLNALTRRHLEFFYRDVLGMFKKRAVPDKVHVLVDLDAGTRELLLPAGTALSAGKDSLGVDLVYRTERGLLANRVEVGRISSLRAEIRVTGIREASRQYRTAGTPQEAFAAMFRIALGSPPGSSFALPNQSIPEVTFAALEQSQKLVEVVERGLGMPLFDDFRELMRLKRLRQEREEGDWKRINQYFRLDPKDARAFEAKLETLLGRKLAGLFDGLAEVNNVDEAYAHLLARPDDDEAAKFIRDKLAPLSLEDFKAVMRIKTAMDEDWEAINRLVETAGKRRNAKFAWPKDARAKRDVAAKLTAAGLDLTSGADFKFNGDIDAYYAALLAVERHFHMSADNFKYVMSAAPRGAAPQADEWDGEKTYEILAAAHARMIYRMRRERLDAVAKAAIARGGENVNVKALRDVLAVVMGDDGISLDEALQKLGALGVADSDGAYLNEVARGAAPDWARVVEVLEIAQRNREDLKEPVAEKVEWRNLYPTADARQPAGRWKTFGRGEQALEQQPAAAPAASFGWALTSPLLALAEGNRAIELSLGFSVDGRKFDLAQNPLRIELSTAKGWLEPQSAQLAWAEPGLDYTRRQGAPAQKLLTLKFDLAISESQPALAPLAREVHGIDTAAPVLRLMVKPAWHETDKCYVTASYQFLRELSLVRARLVVRAAGLKGLSIANDQGVLEAKKPFEPFGTVPAVGSRFHLGHPEIVGKKLDSLTFNITWMGAPPDLAKHYKNYSDKADDFANKNFQAKVALAEGGVLRDFPSPLTLFNKDDAGKPVSITLAPPADQGNPDNAGAVPADITDWNRRLVWELTPADFQHSVYTKAALQKSLAMAAAVANAANAPAASKPTVNAADYQVNPPHTPKIRSLTLDYAASGELVLDAATAASGAVRVFHVEPFGYAELKPGVVPGSPFLPKYELAGELYIGLRNAAAPQNVSLLFQVAEGSANPDLAPGPVKWSYLSGNEWLPMEEESLLADGTRGFVNSGIVELALKPAQPGTRLLPADLYWIRAAVARAPDGVCDMVEVHPNAVSASFADAGNAPDHLKAPLPPESIKGPAAPMPGVARIRQPYSSFGGKMAEQDASFYVRVSERLRHKERALTAWDYERLVLEKFPQLYKVKCLRSAEPGTIELVVIPDIKNRLPFNPFEPKAPMDLIRDVEAFLQDKIPPFARVKVKNAHYVPVKVRCGVRFLPGQDESFCRKRLNEELNRFLSPWAYEEGADIAIGGSVYANSIIDFIDSRDYVDYLVEFKLFTSEDGGGRFLPVPEPEPQTAAEGEGYSASARRPGSVLVAAREHQFDMISEADYRLERFAGVDYMRIELDFKVS